MINYKNNKSQLIEDGKERYLELILNDIQLEEFEFGVINSNLEKGFIQVEKSRFNANINIKYCITGYESLDEYIDKNVIDKFSLIKFFKAIAKILLENKDLLLKTENFAVEKENIFINKETTDIKLIYIPLKERYCTNINESYMDMIKDVLNYAWSNNKIESKSAETLTNIRNKADENGITISKFIEFIQGEVPNNSGAIIHGTNRISNERTVENNNISRKVKENIKKSNQNESKKEDYDLKTQESKKEQEELNKQNRPDNVNDGVDSNSKGKKGVNNKVNLEGQEEIIEEPQYKIWRVITSITIQPIFIGIILALFILEGITSTQLIGGGLLILALDALVIKNLLDPSKKEVIKVSVKSNKSKKSNKENNLNNTGLNINNGEKVDSNSSEIQNIDRVKPKYSEVKRESINNDPFWGETGCEPDTSFEKGGTTFEALAYLEIDNGNGISKEEILINNYVIGRSENLRSYINSTSVSRKHLEIVNSNGMWSLRDLGSKNGTKINGVKIGENEERELNDGDIIVIPGLTITFKL